MDIIIKSNIEMVLLILINLK